MTRPNRKKLEHMKANDKALAKLPSVKEEEQKMKKGESRLARWLTKKLISKKKVKEVAREAKQSSKE